MSNLNNLERKIFEYDWPSEKFLVHIELSLSEAINLIDQIEVYHIFENTFTSEIFKIPKNISSHRFIISKSKPKEVGIKIEYDSRVVLIAYEIDDRAYYPTEYFYKD